MTITSLIIALGIGGICAYVHKNKGYSAVSGFCWGLFFNVIGLLVVLSERTKEEQMEADKNGLSMLQWLAIFVGVGTLLIIITIFVVDRI